METQSFVTDLISNVGFPITITIFLLVSFQRKIDQLNKTLIELSEIFRDIISKGEED